MTTDDSAKKNTDEPFLARWARIKRDQTQAAAPAAEMRASSGLELANTGIDEHLQPKMPEEARAEPGLPNSTAPASLPSLDNLTPQSDFSPFMAKNVDTQLRNQAMKKLFTDPHYNVMDGLDIYIDDYSIERPLSIEVIRQMSISKTLGLFDDEEKDADPAAGATATTAQQPNEADGLPAVEEEVIALTPEADREEGQGKREPLTRLPVEAVTKQLLQKNQ